MTLSAVIPTKNRPADLQRAVASILAQTRGPDELIIVDQSEGSESRELVEKMFAGNKSTRLVYLHDTTVSGLVEAKSVAAARAVCDIVAFLEDDVVLEPDYAEWMLWGFERQPDMCGCGGVITNPERTSSVYVLLHGLFLRGIFRDPRARIVWTLQPDATELIPCDVISGGLSAWPAHVLRTVHFDTSNGFHMFEDMEFATRVVKALGHRLFINPRARLAHYASAVNRDLHGARQRRKMAEAIIFYRKRRQWRGAVSGLTMGAVWWFGEALMQSVRLRTVGPLRGYFRGTLDGWRRPLLR